MVRLSTTQKNLRQKVLLAHLQRRRRLAAMATHTITRTLDTLKHVISPRLLHNSIRTGPIHMRELFLGHPDAFFDYFGMSTDTFEVLAQELQKHTGFTHTKHVSMAEQLGIFLFMLRHGRTVRMTAHEFQRSLDTVHR